MEESGVDLKHVSMADGSPLPKRVELYPWNQMARQLRGESKILDTSIYQTLDEWQVCGRGQRRKLKRKVLAIEQGLSKHERERTAKLQAKTPETPKPGKGPR